MTRKIKQEDKDPKRVAYEKEVLRNMKKKDFINIRDVKRQCYVAGEFKKRLVFIDHILHYKEDKIKYLLQAFHGLLSDIEELFDYSNLPFWGDLAFELEKELSKKIEEYQMEKIKIQNKPKYS
jgi:sugar-specific transcriptional regulator TrmB